MSLIRSTSTLLRRALLGNALFSGLSGVTFAMATEALADVLGIDALWAIQLLGLGLLLYAVWLVISALTVPIHRRDVWTAILLDTGWVVGSVVLLAGNWMALTQTGMWAVAIVADIVALFAILQFYALQRMSHREATR